MAGSGVAMMIASVLVAPMIDVFAKLAAATVPAAEITLGRFIVQALLMMPFALARGHLFSRSVRLAALHVIRGLVLATGMVAFVFALKTMPIADAIAIFFLEPAILTLMSGVVLREPIGWKKVVACATGFGGSLLVIQPSFAAFGAVTLLPVITAFTVAIFLLITRAIAHLEDPWAMQFQSSFWAVVGLGTVLAAARGGGSAVFDLVVPTPTALVFVVGVGLSAALSSILGGYAYRAAPASVLAPLQYLEIVSAAVLAYLVFGDFPDAVKWLGIAIIIASGVFVIVGGRASRAPATDAAP
jgi:drug/metabolite transporter (DMT)-like permease